MLNRIGTWLLRQSRHKPTMASASTAWLSVVIKRGTTVVCPRKIVNVLWESNFGELLMATDSALEKESVLKVVISTNKRFIDPVHEVSVTAPIFICDTFKCQFVCIYLRESSDVSVSVQTTNPATGLYLSLSAPSSCLFVCHCSVVCACEMTVCNVCFSNRPKCIRYFGPAHKR